LGRNVPDEDIRYYRQLDVRHITEQAAQQECPAVGSYRHFDLAPANGEVAVNPDGQFFPGRPFTRSMD
jgi:hypothetical protein